jgi:Putative lumazine-binding
MFSSTFSHLAACTGIVASILVPPMRPPQPEDPAVRQTIEAFASGAATQDVVMLERTLHPLSVQFITGKEIRTVDRPTYLAAIREKKMGGQPMTVTVQSVQVDGGTASAKATFTAAPFVLSHSLSLVKTDGRWMIVSTVVTVLPR